MQSSTVYRVFLASPSDVAEERNIVRDVIGDWNAANSFDRGVVVEPVGYESHTEAQLGSDPQDIINKQLLDRCDFLIAIFWTRLGTPTETEVAGTVEEIKRFGELKGEDRVLVFFSERPCSPSVDPGKLAKLIDFKEQMLGKGFCLTYKDSAEFARKLRQQLDLRLNRLLPDRLQIERDILVTVKHGEVEKRKITAHILRDDAAPRMNGATFMRGLEVLHEQITCEESHLRPDFFIGVNQAGLMAASYLEGRLHPKIDLPMGVIRTPSKDVRHQEKRLFLYPEGGLEYVITEDILKKAHSVFIVDGQMKSGWSAYQLRKEFTRDRYRHLDVYLALVVVCGVETGDLKGEVDRDRLFEDSLNGFLRSLPEEERPKSADERQIYMPDFVAFLSEKPVKAPEGIR